jgi:hypothetical protein
MDKLYPEIRKLKQMVFLATQKLNAGKITIMFYPTFRTRKRFSL